MDFRVDFDFNPFYPFAVLDWNESGMFIVKQNNCSAFSDLRKYNFAVKSWKSFELPESLRSQFILEFFGKSAEPGFLIFFGWYRNEEKYALILYDLNKEMGVRLQIEGEGPSFDGNNKNVSKPICLKDHSLYFLRQEPTGLRTLYTLDLKNSMWKKLADLSGRFDLSCNVSLVPFDNTLFLFENVSKIGTNEEDAFEKCAVFSFDLLTLQLSEVSLSISVGMKKFITLSHRDSVYLLRNPLEPDLYNKNIWRFHKPTSSWSALPIEIPRLSSNFCVVSYITNDGHIYVADRFLKIRRKINIGLQPLSLQALCWDMISGYPRSVPLTSYSKDQLLSIGIPDIFCFKLFS